ncbi:MAG: alpha/beta hydrolase [Lachnospiraceae bacterium]|nr:alpha/beta hydrolase [Lachnospiraceae bacterium]
MIMNMEQEPQYKDIAYQNESASQKLDIYLPNKEQSAWPALIYIHGGGFMFGDKQDSHLKPYLQALEHGFAVVSVEYRLSKEAIFPAAVLDVRNAVRYVRKHAAEYHLDATRLIAIGGSAGGNLAAMLGMNVPNGEFPGEEGMNFEENPYVAVAIDQFGPMNFATMDAQARENGISDCIHDEANSPESMYIGGEIQSNLDLVRKANPATYISENTAPFLIFHGTKDVMVPFMQSVVFAGELLEKVNPNSVEFIPVADAGHDDPKIFTEENMNQIYSFIQKHTATLSQK